MKFYSQICRGEHWDDMEEDELSGDWATRADAEQAAKDAVEMAHTVQMVVAKDSALGVASQRIIDKYKRGKPCPTTTP